MPRRLVAGLLAAGAAAIALGAEPGGPDPRLAGRWEGLDGIGRCSGFVFEKGGNVTAFVSRGEVVIPDAKKAARMHYATDEVSGLSRMDLILADASGRELQRLFAIYRFPSGNQLEIRTYYNENRPTGWGPDPDARNMVLTRLTFANQALVCRIAERKPKPAP
jgi:hypothetical protein